MDLNPCEQRNLHKRIKYCSDFLEGNAGVGWARRLKRHCQETSIYGHSGSATGGRVSVGGENHGGRSGSWWIYGHEMLYNEWD